MTVIELKQICAKAEAAGFAEHEVLMTINGFPFDIDSVELNMKGSYDPRLSLGIDSNEFLGELPHIMDSLDYIFTIEKK